MCQTTSPDTLTAFSPEQLRITALIFAEHRFLKEEHRLLTAKYATLQKQTEDCDRMTSEYRNAIASLERNRLEADRARETINETLRNQLQQQKRKTRRKTIIGITAGLVVGVAVGAAI